MSKGLLDQGVDPTDTDDYGKSQRAIEFEAAWLDKRVKILSDPPDEEGFSYVGKIGTVVWCIVPNSDPEMVEVRLDDIENTVCYFPHEIELIDEAAPAEQPDGAERQRIADEERFWIGKIVRIKSAWDAHQPWEYGFVEAVIAPSTSDADDNAHLAIRIPNDGHRTANAYDTEIVSGEIKERDLQLARANAEIERLNKLLTELPPLPPYPVNGPSIVQVAWIEARAAMATKLPTFPEPDRNWSQSRFEKYIDAVSNVWTAAQNRRSA